MRNILVTGGAGFIGSHTVVELIDAGFRPIIIDNFKNSDRRVLDQLEKLCRQKITFYEGNVGDKTLLEKVISIESVDGVIHFAAYKAVGESVDNPLMYYENNVGCLIDVLSVLEEKGVKNLVFSSSCTVYGEALKLPITEDEPVKAASSPYGSTKQMDETIIRDTVAVTRHLRALSLRYFNPIGAHPSSLIGELPLGHLPI